MDCTVLCIESYSSPVNDEKTTREREGLQILPETEPQVINSSIQLK